MLLIVINASAQELEPGAYSNVPVGLNFNVAVLWCFMVLPILQGEKPLVDGIKSNDLQNNSRTGTDYDSISVFWKYRWCAGL